VRYKCATLTRKRAPNADRFSTLLHCQSWRYICAFIVHFGRPFVKWFALCYRTVVLSVCDVGVLWLDGWMNQDETWHGGRPRPRPHCVRWGSSLLSKKGQSPPPIFGSCLLWQNGQMAQDATWYGGRPQPRPQCVRRRPSFPRKGHSSPPLPGPCLL